MQSSSLTNSYQQAFTRIYAEYVEMPGMRLTPSQVQRLCGVDISICTFVLDDLVRAKFLCAAPDGRYVRRTDGAVSPMQGANAGLNASTRPPVSRRAH